MDYQNIITKYQNDDLEVSNFKNKLEMAKSLVGRPSLRAEQTVFDYSVLFNYMKNLLLLKEITSNYDIFHDDINKVLFNNFDILLSRIKECKAWVYLKLNAKNYTKEKFEKISIEEKIEVIKLMNDRYCDFLDIQGTADVRDCLQNANNLDDVKIKKINFIISMFENFKNDKVKEEFFCLNKQFLKLLLGFKKSKAMKLDVYFSTKSKKVQRLYEKYANYFSIDDFFEIAENINLTSKNAKINVQTTIEMFSEISEIAEEKRYVKLNSELLNEIKEKYEKFLKLQTQYLKDKEDILEKKRTELSRKKAEEQLKKQREIEEKYRRIHEEIDIRKIKDEDNNNVSEFDIEIEKNNKKENKEVVVPIVFTWLGRENYTLTQIIGNKTLTEFFDKLKEIEKSKKAKVKLFLLTNADKDETVKRVFDINRKAKENGMPKILEGAFGGYSSFRVDNNGDITDISKMSPKNKSKIIKLLELSKNIQLNRALIDKTENDFIRYELNCDKNHLNYIAKELLKDEKVARQPLNIMAFAEKNISGLDILLNSQVKGISQLKDYFMSKYDVFSNIILKINIEKIESFINNEE